MMTFRTLPPCYTQVVQFILQNTEGKGGPDVSSLPVTGGGVDPFTGGGSGASRASTGVN